MLTFNALPMIHITQNMGTEIRCRGKTYTEHEIEDIRQVIAGNPDKSRFFLSKELCRLWNWTQPNGTHKDMVCCGLMLFLDQEGLIALPPKKRELIWLCPDQKKPPQVEADAAPYAAPLSTLRPLDLRTVRRTPKEKLYQSLIDQYHYLGYTRPIGEHLEYIAFSKGKPVAYIGFSSAPPSYRSKRQTSWMK
jgi:hypothetical protein